MCGRFTYKFTWSEIHDHLAGFVSILEEQADEQATQMPPRFNVAPTQPILVFKRQGAGVHARLMRWGLVPEWVKDPKDFPLIVNARSETLVEKASFRNAIKNRRCIIPASGYYEWLRSENEKIPHYISLKSGEPMLFAGLHSTWVGPDGEEVDTATIITVPANEELAKIHNRSPALLFGDQVSDWLDDAHVNAVKAQAMLKPIELGTTHSHPVSKRVNSARNEGEDLIVPVFDQPMTEDDLTAQKLDTSDEEAAQKDSNKSQLDLF